MKRFCIVLIVAIQSIFLFGQTPELPDVCTAFKPSALLSKTLKAADMEAFMASSSYGQNEPVKRKSKWVAYSDREDNTTYKTSSGNEKFMALKFNEKVRIAMIKGSRALIYSEPKEDTKWPKISKDAKCLGWIPMKNLLLWDGCLANANGIYCKAILCLNANFSSTDRGKGFLNPNNRQNSSFDLVSTFQFYYVMKQEGEYALLATQPQMAGYSEKVLYAWVPKTMYVEWNQRSCMETTWNKEDIAYFAQNKMMAQIYKSPSMTGLVSSYSFQLDKKDPRPDEDDEFYRWDGTILRYPILDGSTADRIKCTALQGKFGNKMAPDSTLIKRQKMLEDVSHINVIVLLDATRSMDIYRESIAEAIREGCNDFSSDNYKVRVGVMLYRDYADGIYQKEWSNFTRPDDERLKEFILSGGEYGYKSSPNDKTNTEALFAGMSDALARFKHPEQSNLLLVVGDCGNSVKDKKFTQEGLINQIVAKNVNIVGYQVRNKEDNQASWTLFNNQMIAIIRGSLQKKVDNIKKGSKIAAYQYKNGIGTRFVSNRDSADVLFIAEHRYNATAGKVLKAQFLTELMQLSFNQYSRKIQGLQDMIVNKKSYEGTKTGDASNWDITEEFLRQQFGTSNVSGLIGYTGWTYRYKSNREVWKPVLFITRTELSELLVAMGPLYAVAKNPNSNDRKPYAVALKNLVDKMAPGTDLNEKNINEIMARIEGLNIKTEMSGRKLSDVLDKDVVSQQEYRDMLSDFAKKYNFLKTKIFDNNEYKCKMTYNKVTYYWIAANNLP